MKNNSGSISLQESFASCEGLSWCNVLGSSLGRLWPSWIKALQIWDMSQHEIYWVTFLSFVWRPTSGKESIAPVFPNRGQSCLLRQWKTYRSFCSDKRNTRYCLTWSMFLGAKSWCTIWYSFGWSTTLWNCHQIKNGNRNAKMKPK